jgi:hypothetical protein
MSADKHFQRFEEMRLVATATIDALAARETVTRERKHIARNSSHLAAANLGVEAEAGNVIAQLLALFRTPIFRNVPRRIE